ncbi:transcription initiation factor TFIID subunit 9 [Cinnamomum micranthum f. kanehirae]|uniref:Transcription initiation factor TFIID subunit 9 n=1 Tax=Cinnamomum micranthum f. kanehirae TaxID=337451 RepID=A0A443P2D7_9MAGN|nr:transcription initiation factor TFIID subunit 9 [Cinnamomum micranthum f. kanehirae]
MTFTRMYPGTAAELHKAEVKVCLAAKDSPHLNEIPGYASVGESGGVVTVKDRPCRLVAESKMGESGGLVTVKEKTVVEEGEGDGEDVPRDAKIVKTLLRLMGVREYEPRVVHQFLELWYRYVVDVLSDAQAYSEHAGKPSIDCDDVKFAIQTKVNFSFSQPPPRELQNCYENTFCTPDKLPQENYVVALSTKNN